MKTRLIKIEGVMGSKDGGDPFKGVERKVVGVRLM